ALPDRTAAERVEDFGQEGVAGADVGPGVVVVAPPGAGADEARVDEGDVGQCAGPGGGHELLVGLGDRSVAPAPHAEERRVGVVVPAGGAAGLVEPVPD